MKFNPRVYAFLEKNKEILLLKEPFQGKTVVKLPGGGLEPGEGTIECLEREFLEELNLEIEVTSHIYTLDHFLKHQIYEEQLLLIYYTVKAKNGFDKLKCLDPDIEEMIWKPIHELKPSDLDLKTDQIAFKKYLDSKK